MITELTQDWGNRLLEGTNKTLDAPGPRKKEQGPMRDSPRLARECPGVSGGGVGRRWPAARLGALSAAVHAWDLLKEAAIIFITSTIVWPQVKQQGGNTALSTEICVEDLLSMALPIRTRPSFPLSQSLPSGSLHKLLILIHQRAKRMKTTITEN